MTSSPFPYSSLMTYTASFSIHAAFNPNLQAIVASGPFFSNRTFRLPTANVSRTSRISCHNRENDGLIDRRNVLIGIGGVYGAAGLGADPFALAEPISPDKDACGTAEVPPDVTPTNCCPPPSSKIIDFQPPGVESLGIRPAAQLASQDYIDKYNRVIKLMKALPEDDPRNAYFDRAYNQIGFPDLKINVHRNWLFFPFHRCYLYFHEKILGKLLGDPSFTLPYWNWDNPQG